MIAAYPTIRPENILGRMNGFHFPSSFSFYTLKKGKIVPFIGYLPLVHDFPVHDRVVHGDVLDGVGVHSQYVLMQHGEVG